jgi:3-hydroxyisobutyrate dehydrogenase-like beta-hydroxyacid dehydrogenase
MKIGFIGLGNMGLPIARNLIKAGHKLTVYNRTRSRAEELQPLGAHVATMPFEAASGAEVSFTNAGDDRAVEDIIFRDRALPSVPSRRRCSYLTEHNQVWRCLAVWRKPIAKKGSTMLLHRSLAGPDAAAGAKLFIVAAGPAKQIERCNYLRRELGRRDIPVGVGKRRQRA